MTIGIYYRDINTDVGDAFDVRSIVKCLSEHNKVIVFCSRKNKHKIINDNISYMQTDSLLELLLNTNKVADRIDFFHLFCGLIPSIPILAQLLQFKKISYTYSPFGQLMPETVKKNKYKKSLYIKLLLKRTLSKANFIHVNSKYEKIVIESLGINNNILISSLAIEGYEIKYNSRKDLPKEYFSFIGRLDIWHKGLDLLLLAVKKNQKEIVEKKIKIILAGRASEKELNNLNQLIQKYELGDIILLKRNISDEEKQSILQKSYFFVHPSRVEGFARSMREAISLKIPLITTYDSNVGDYVKDENAGYVANCDVDSISDTLKQALQNLNGDFSQGMITLQKLFTWENLCQDLNNAYKKYK